MDLEIQNGGKGSKIGTHVDQNEQLHIFATQQSVIQDSVAKGNAYNINTGTIGLTSTSDSAVLYFLNDEAPVNGESTIIIDAIAVGIGDGGTKDEKATITIIKNPTTGSIIDTTPVVVDMNSNRNFGSNNTLSTTSLALKGAEADTLTNGSDFAQFFQTTTRGFYSIDVELPRGSSIGININPQTSAGTTDVYVAVILHRKDGKND